MVYCRVKSLSAMTSQLMAVVLGLLCLLSGGKSYAIPASNYPPIVHLTQAEYLIDSTQPLPSLPSELIEDSTLHGQWKPTPLPLVLKKTTEQGPNHPKSVWVRVPLDSYANHHGPLSLFLVRVVVVGELSIYADGHLIYHSTGTPMWNLNYRPSVLIPLVNSVDGVPPRNLLFKVDWLAGGTVGLSSLYVGAPEWVEPKANIDNLIIKQIPFAMSIALFAISIVGLAIWYMHRLYPGHLILINSLLGIIWRWHLFFGAEFPKLSDELFTWLITNAALWGTITTHFLIQALHKRKAVGINRLILSLGILISLISLPLDHPSLIEIARHAAMMYVITTGLLLFITVMDSYKAWRSGSTEAKFVALTMIIGWIGVLSDIVKMFTLTNMESLYYSTYTLRLFLIAYIYLMIHQYVSLLRQNRSANAVLTQRLQEKEIELTQYHERMREIERGQILSTERQRLMQDMHDGLGSTLTSALHMIEHRHADMSALEHVIRKCIDDLKLTVDSLEPLDGDLLLLLATLRYRLGQQLQSSGINIVWEVTTLPKLDWLDPHNAMHILRILQEALSNVLQHAHATEVHIATHANENSVSVSITDNGQGFDIDKAKNQGGHGLANQQRRAAEIGGQVSWKSSNAGTQLELTLPRYPH